MKKLLDHYVENKKKLQIKFVNDPSPPIEGTVTWSNDLGVYQLAAQAMVPDPRNRAGRPVTLVVSFQPESVLWTTEGPPAQEEPLVRGVSAGGIHIG